MAANQDYMASAEYHLLDPVANSVCPEQTALPAAV